MGSTFSTVSPAGDPYPGCNCDAWRGVVPPPPCPVHSQPQSFGYIYDPTPGVPLVDPVVNTTVTIHPIPHERIANALERIATVTERFANGWLGRLMGMKKHE